MPSITKTIQGSGSVSVSKRVAVAQMGDGYVQTAEDGINSLQEEWSVVFTPMKLTDAQAFNTLLKSYIRTTVIDWQAPMESSLTKWKITAYSVREIAGKVYEFNVTFVRHYGV